MTIPKTMEKMRRRLALAAAAAAVALAACGGADEGMPPPSIEPVEPPSSETDPDRGREQALRIPGEGNPVVWIRRGERVRLYDRPGGEVIETAGEETEFGSRTVFAVQQRRRDWAAVPTPYFENGRLAWLRLDPRVLRAGSTPWEIHVDLSDYQASLISNGKRVRTFAVSIGMPGAETPTGRFAVTDTFRGDLNAAYGCCAVALTARQVRLPSGWLGGDRIAIHGTDGPLGSAVSHGCIRAADRDVSELVNRVPPGTPVIVRQ